MKRENNKSMGVRRTKIKKPFYFYTVNRNNNLFVQCGLEEGYEKRFVFSAPTGKGGDAYRQCFNEFVEKARAAKCFMRQQGEGSLLYYWTRPERLNDEANPLKRLLSEPIDSFSEYTLGSFEDMPEIKN